MTVPSLRGGVHRLEDAIITLSGPGIALSGIIAGVDLLTGGHAMSGMPWLTMTWAICLLLSLDFQVLALGARAHRVYLSQKPTGRKVAEVVLALAIASAISYVSIQMQSIVAEMNAAGLSIDQATSALGINASALIFERSILVLVLIFLSGWFRHEDAEPAQVVQVNATGLNQPAQWAQLEEWFNQVVQMNQGMLNQFFAEHLSQVVQLNQGMLNQITEAYGVQLNQVNQRMDLRLNQVSQLHLNELHQATRGLAGTLETTLNRCNDASALLPDQFNDLANRLATRQQRQFDDWFTQFSAQLTLVQSVQVREERQTSGRLRAISAPTSATNTAAEPPDAADGSLVNQLAGSSSESGQRVLNYLNQCKETGSGEPSLIQIEQVCQVAHNTAIAWRRHWRERQTQLVGTHS